MCITDMGVPGQLHGDCLNKAFGEAENQSETGQGGKGRYSWLHSVQCIGIGNSVPRWK